MGLVFLWNFYGAGSLVRRIAYDRATGLGVQIFFSIFSKISEIKCKNLENCLKVDCRFFVDGKREKCVFFDYFAICDELCQIWPKTQKNVISTKSWSKSHKKLMFVLYSFGNVSLAISSPNHSLS